MNLLVSASFLASFLAGLAALFAPCCITVLLPTYFASIFKQKRTIFLMTFVFFLGLLSVYVPIGLGVSILSQLFGRYHQIIFGTGGLLLLFLGLTQILGVQFSLPTPVHPQLKKSGMLSVFFLGIFSGIATTCCAPVLAGVLALAALPGSSLLGVLYTITYVLGMVVPLFLLAAILDKADFSKKLMSLRKPISRGVNILSGLMFLVIGGTLVYSAITNKLAMQSSYQLTVNIYLAQLTKYLSNYTKIIPEPIWAVFFLLILLIILGKAVKQCKNNKS